MAVEIRYVRSGNRRGPNCELFWEYECLDSAGREISATIFERPAGGDIEPGWYVEFHHSTMIWYVNDEPAANIDDATEIMRAELDNPTW